MIHRVEVAGPSEMFSVKPVDEQRHSILVQLLESERSRNISGGHAVVGSSNNLQLLEFARGYVSEVGRLANKKTGADEERLLGKASTNFSLGLIVGTGTLG